MEWLEVDDQGVIAAGRIVAVGRAETAAMKHLLGGLSAAQVVGMTGGRKRQTVVVLDSGHVVITAMSLSRVVGKLKGTPGGLQHQGV